MAARDVQMKNMFNGGLRRRLRVTTRGGEPELFVVRNADRAVSQINGLLGNVAPGAPRLLRFAPSPAISLTKEPYCDAAST